LFDKNLLSGESVDEDYTQVAMKQLQSLGYVSEPHAAIGYRALVRQLAEDEVGVFLGTAPPAKFRETVENVLGQPIQLPQPLVDVAGKPSLAGEISADYDALKAYMLKTLGGK
jgi:threonine synthase